MSRKLPAILLLALLVIFSATAWLVPEAKQTRAHSAQSSQDDGRRALLLLLKHFQFDAQRSEQRPGTLPTSAGLVWLARLPIGAEVSKPESSEEFAGQARGATPLRTALLRGLSNPEHYRRFAAGGGSVVVEIADTKELDILANDFGFFEIRHLELVARTGNAAAADAPLRCKWISGEAIQLSAPEGQCLTGLESLRQVDVLLQDEQSSPLIVELSIQRGSLVLVTCGAVFDNAKLSLPDHAVLAVRLAERCSHAGSIWIDESSGLGGDMPTLLELAVQARALPFSVAVILFALLFTWRSFFAREISRDPPPVEFMSPRTRALARARLFQRARRFDLLVQSLRRGTVQRIQAAAKLSPSTCIEALQSSEGARRFARALGVESGAEAWIEALVSGPAASARDLVLVDSELRELEDQYSSSVRRVQRRYSA